MKFISIILAATFSGSLMAKSLPGDYLVKIAPTMQTSAVQSLQSRLPAGTQIEDLGVAGWMHVKLPANRMSAFSTRTILNMPGVLAMHPNHIITLNATWQIKDPAKRAAIAEMLKKRGGDDDGGGGFPFPGGDQPAADNPAIPTAGSGGSGPDPLADHQWGMKQMGVQQSWGSNKGTSDVVVAVIDTGVDYTHEDLVDNIWHNPGETGTDANGKDKSSNGIDDDKNGYVDDVIGWDFASNDNKPYDLTASLTDILLSGGNPGHGTHCAGNVAARADNGKGITGVAPGVRIMPLRFISEKGQGTTADAVKAIKYAVANGAKVMSNSWGSEGDDPKDGDTQALKDAITMAMEKGVLFVAAAGNGHNGVGYDNDTDPKPGVPASYAIENIISVAAIDEAGKLGSFSNWGAKTVHIAAPGVKVFSTVTQKEKYSDTLIDLPGMGKATWDGTSMACPHVAGAAALYISQHPDKSWRDVKAAIIGSAKKNPNLTGKMVSGGQLDVLALSKF